MVLLGNALVPHSVDHMMSLIIHLSPHIAAHCLRWHTENDLFPIDQVLLSEYIQLPLTFLAAWAMLHAAFMLAFGDALRSRHWNTTYHYNMSSRGGRNIFTAVLGRIGEGGSETLRFLKYEVISVALNAAILCTTYPLYAYGTPEIHFAVVLCTGLFAAWNGASWYNHRLQKFTRQIDRQIEQCAPSKPKES